MQIPTPHPRACLVLCMAGLYQRFRDAGFTTPKFLLPWHGTPLIEHILGHMLDPAAFDAIFCVANKRDEPHAHALRALLARFGVPAPNLVFVGDTKGQAHTARIGAELARQTGCAGPIVFHNIDTVLVGRDYHRIVRWLREHEGFIDIFDADSPAFSYVAHDEHHRVTEIREKEVISRHATTGLYGFSSPAAYIDLIDEVEQARGPLVRSGQRKPEFYISEIYESMIAKGRSVVATPPGPSSKTIIIGTPAEYEAARTIPAPPGPFARTA